MEEGYPGIMPFRELFDELGTHLLDDVRAPPVYHHYDEMDGTVLEAMVERVQAYDALRLVDKESSKRVDVNRDFRATKPMVHEVIVYLIATKQEKRLNEMHRASGNLVRWADPEDALGKLLRRCYTAHMTLITFALGYYNIASGNITAIAKKLNASEPLPVVLAMGMVEGQQYRAFHQNFIIVNKMTLSMLKHLGPVLKTLLLKDDVDEFKRFFDDAFSADDTWITHVSTFITILTTPGRLNETSWKHPQQISMLLGPRMANFLLRLICNTDRKRNLSAYRGDFRSMVQCLNDQNVAEFRICDAYYCFALLDIQKRELEGIFYNGDFTLCIPATPATIAALIHWLGPNRLADEPDLQRVLCTWAATDFALPHLRAHPATATWTFPADLHPNRMPPEDDYNSRRLYPHLLRDVMLADLLDTIGNCTDIPDFQWYHVITFKNTSEVDTLIVALQRANAIRTLSDVLTHLNGNAAHDPIALHIMPHPRFAENAIFLHCLAYLYDRETFIIFDACAQRISLLKDFKLDGFLMGLLSEKDAYGAIERYLRLVPATDTDTDRKKNRTDCALRLYEAFNTPTTASILDLVSGTNPRYPEPIIKDAKRQKKED